ncbi:MAG: ferritin-like domain-containing protein [Gemmatimonadota bacterium]
MTSKSLHPLTTPRHAYVRLAAAADRGYWSVERDIRWDEVNPENAHARPAVLAQLRDAALIESFHPVHLGWMLDDAWSDVDAGVAIAFEMYEGFKHFHALRTYLDLVGYKPAITNEEIVGIRERARQVGPQGTLVERLVEFMLSEHLASYFFRRLGEQAVDLPLAQLLSFIAADEVRHAQAASDLLAAHITREPELIPAVLDAAVHFHHFGEQVVDEVPVSFPGDPLAIRSFAKRIERLCGVRIVDHLKLRL